MSENSAKRSYKDSLFRMVFREKKELLSLYNAINGTCYEDPEKLIVTTIEDVLYMGRKNDVSFLIQDILNLYEHQSSWNPNMPLRGLFYISMLYQGYVKQNDLDIYSGVLLKLPTPRYVVFYNGTRNEPDRVEMRLSDSFIKRDDSHCLECTALALNINYGHNKELMKACRKLYEYACLVEKVREYLSQGLKLEPAVDKAVQYCIEADILKEFLLKHRAEVKQVILTEYDEKRHARTLFEEGGVQALRKSLIRCIEKRWTLSDELRKRIEDEKEFDTLQDWLMFAMDCSSLEELEGTILLQTGV